MEGTISWLTESILKASGHFKAGSVFLLKKDACGEEGDNVFHFCKRVWACSKKHCLCLRVRVEADSGNKSSTLFLSRHNPVYG